ncbi:Cyclopropane-fatty-acyl-phospholipid synthase [Pirellula staleyi DSM 6068]|uniref:Cyclopropane-fatty-acyl-phospholipid synthase n=1 Tax=Pirellula staleyi (strain ATCC 27377 / DSM 6068 / ICPB 4128) TaxID=530564 RepID=D2R616_PIRSD|nr:cyclopropane fatty acyl phospholipid synthase [Pirellula staleyi]ADB19101.1 Cyclopropane-fatty-acyl-phospholipid synthase [Pirellula staleyi DSM 6068]
MASSLKSAVARSLADADIIIGGSRAWDITVHDTRMYTALATSGSLGAGESYMNGWWDCDALDQMAERYLRSISTSKIAGGRFYGLLERIRAKYIDLQVGLGGREIARVHYDLPSDLFESMLGPTMNYSCGYWREANDLTTAQNAKMHLICRKLGLRPGMRVLDVGCGWGGLIQFVVREYSCSVVGITVSAEQARYASKKCNASSSEVYLLDYRDLRPETHGTFDAITSVGMLEHVGPRNYARYFDIMRRLLKPSGLLLVQSFGRERSEPVDRWINRYIFPNSYVPNGTELLTATRGRFIVEDWHNFGADYDRTLLAWHTNFENWAIDKWKVTAPKRYRMWRYYLLTFAAGFRVRDRVQLWQIVLSPEGVPKGYVSLR